MISKVIPPLCSIRLRLEVPNFFVAHQKFVSEERLFGFSLVKASQVSFSILGIGNTLEQLRLVNIDLSYFPITYPRFSLVALIALAAVTRRVLFITVHLNKIQFYKVCLILLTYKVKYFFVRFLTEIYSFKTNNLRYVLCYTARIEIN